MRFLFFILIVLLIVQVGFWKTVAAIVGAAVMFFVLFPLLMAVAILGGLLFVASR